AGVAVPSVTDLIACAGIPRSRFGDIEAEGADEVAFAVVLIDSAVAAVGDVEVAGVLIHRYGLRAAEGAVFTGGRSRLALGCHCAGLKARAGVIGEGPPVDNCRDFDRAGQCARVGSEGRLVGAAEGAPEVDYKGIG